MSNLHIITSHNIKLFFTPASIGERILAYGVDFLIQISYLVIISLILSKVFFINFFNDLSDGSGIILLLIMLPVLFYSLICESTMEGQTFGKKLLKIKVVKIDGYQAGFFDYFIRWIFSIVDIQMMYIPGVFSMLTTKHTRRLGDLAAGTAVITEKSKYNINHTILMNVEEDYKPTFSKNQIMLFSDNDIRIIKENFELSVKSMNATVLKKLSDKICTVMKITNPFNSDNKLLDTFLKDYNFFTGK